MTHPEDITAFLKAKREDRSPKCANCRFWQHRPATHATIGFCGGGGYSSVDLPATTDLTVCSAWEKKERDGSN